MAFDILKQVCISQLSEIDSSDSAVTTYAVWAKESALRNAPHRTSCAADRDLLVPNPKVRMVRMFSESFDTSYEDERVTSRHRKVFPCASNPKSLRCGCAQRTEST